MPEKSETASLPNDQHSCIRVISDLHLGHPASTVDDPVRLQPLLEGPTKLLFNGDTISEYANRFRQRSDSLWAGISELMKEHGVAGELLSGNHDPTITDLHKVELLDGAVLVTHGDFFFKYVSPWSRKVLEVSDALDEIIANFPGDAAGDLDACLELTREVSMYIIRFQCQPSYGWAGKLATVALRSWPPTRPLRIIKIWLSSHQLALDAMKTYRPDARCLLVGHTHHSYVHEKAGRLVVNTGAFYSLSRPLAVDIFPSERELAVYRIAKKHGRFVIGRELKRIAL